MESTASQAGRVFGERYQILEEVGRGGMAVVYKALDLRLQRLVALKVLYPALASRPETRRRFEREALVVSRLAHPNIVQIFDYSGPDTEDKFIVSEFIEGITLKSYLQRRERLLPELAAMIVEQIALALAHAHSQDIVHRDVKPENVMLGQGAVKLTDFGIAQMVDFEEMTVTGTMVGSPAFMSPEHIEGKTADPRSDIFSLGTLFYHLAVGELPFKAPTAHALLKNILDVQYAPAHVVNPAVGDALSAIISHCLRKNPADRYSSCAELVEAIHTHLRSVGLSDDCSSELKKFFADELRTEAVMRLQVVDALLEQARRLEAKGALGAALRLLDRALALDESRSDVNAELEQMRSRHQRSGWLLKAGLAAGAALLAGVLGFGVYYLVSQPWESGETESAAMAQNDVLEQQAMPERAPEPGEQRGSGAKRSHTVLAPLWLSDSDVQEEMDVSEDESSPEPDLKQKPESPALLSFRANESVIQAQQRVGHWIRSMGRLRAAEGVPPRLPNDGAGADAREKVRRPGGGTPEVKEGGSNSAEGNESKSSGLVTLEAYPPAVEIRVDGRLLGVGKVKTTDLAPGDHTLVLHHPSCTVCEDRSVTFSVPVGTPTQIKERIGFKPAYLVVEATGSGQVFIDGVLAGRLGDPITIQATTHRGWEVDVKVLFDDGRPPASTKAKVQAGERSRVRVP